MLCVEVVIDLRVDLFAFCVKVRAGGEPIIRGIVPPSNPLVNSRIETVSSVEDVGMRHRREKFLCHPARIQARAVNIPGSTFHDGV